ncbi:MAG: hypothetical protein EBX61_04805, partial [Betaproteobacteria bacterium]|nr:hypothetical protein [Betaproteobacteria bacterium]
MQLALFDLDHTLIPADSDHAWGQFLVHRGEVDAKDFAAANDRFYEQYCDGTLDIDAYLRFALAPLASIEPQQLMVLQQAFMQEVIEPLISRQALDLVMRHQARTLRMIGDPATRYREDPVRMLRVARFAAKLGFNIEAQTRAPIAAMADLLTHVPAARLFDELLKLLTSGYSLACIQTLRTEGLHHGLLPLLDGIFASDAGERFIQQALSNTDARIAADKSISPGFLLAALLWPQVLAAWQTRLASGEHNTPALMAAAD